MTPEAERKDWYQKLSQRQEYRALLLAAQQNKNLTELFTLNPDRGLKMCCQAAGLTLDYSKQCIDAEALEQLFQLANSCALKEQIRALVSGDVVNLSENRAACHTALRTPDALLPHNLKDITSELEAMEQLVQKVQDGVWRGFSGKKITDVVNLGVGGSDLGPLMMTYALTEYCQPQAQHLKVHFASTLDGSQLFQLMDHLNPETSLFIISSKSFTTVDTLSNANTVREWLSQYCPNQTLMLRCHFVGVSSSTERMNQWGIPEENQLQFWHWVGGRFSLWSAIGLPIAMGLGMPVFRRLLAGAFQMDQHFIQAPFSENLPVLMALMGIWNVNFCGIRAHAILPYDGRLKYFPAYLEQLEMESNGKSVTQLGETIDYPTCPVLWGEVGANAQHAFYQLLHQGTQAVACDFIVAASRYDDGEQSPHQEALCNQHDLNIANCLAQSRVLAFGNPSKAEKENPFRHYPGNQPSSTLVLDHLDPETLGALIAAYEHKVFCQAVIWGINPFDQWGVELGKQVALQLQPALAELEENQVELDSSTLSLARLIQQQRVKT